MMVYLTAVLLSRANSQCTHCYQLNDIVNANTFVLLIVGTLVWLHGEEYVMAMLILSY